MSHDGEPPEMVRRELLRRSAALGAALVVATPVVQSLGRVAAFGQTSPPPGDPDPIEPEPGDPDPVEPPPQSVIGIDIVGLVFTCAGTTYRAKWKAEGAPWSAANGTSLEGCAAPSTWGGTPVYPDPSAIQVERTLAGNGRDLWKVRFTLPETCTAATGSGVAKGGRGSPSRPGTICLSGVADAHDPRIITFTAPG